MTPKLLALFFLLLLVGCSQPQRQFPSDLIGLDYVSEYDGSSRGDDNDVYARIAQPAGESESLARIQHAVKGSSGSVILGCAAHSREWEGTRWWLEVTLYEEEWFNEERNGKVVSQKRWDIDCAQYWLHIAPDGSMTLTPGHRPGFPTDHPSPGLGAWWLLAGIALSAIVSSRRRPRQR
ncbi:MAG: hypothetical protein ABR586_06425 [Thermoplasmatota archaeon]